MRRTVLIAFIFVLLATFSGPGTAIYDPQVVLAGGGTTTDVQGRAISPDGRFAVFIADREVAGRFELYSVRLDGTTTIPIRLSTPPVGAGEVEQFTIAPDSSRVVFRGDLRTDDVVELFSAPINQPGQQTLLSTTPIPGGRVTDAEVTPDGSRVVYTGDLRTDDVVELFSTLIDQPGQQTLLSTSATFDSNVRAFEVAPDSSRVAYTGDLRTDNVDEMFSAPLDRPGEQTLLSATPLTNSTIFTFAIAPDSSRVVYRGDLRTANVNELFSAPIDQPGQQTLLSTTPTTGGDIDHVNYQIAPDSSRVAYTGDLRTDDVVELFSAPIDRPGQQTLLNTTPTTGGDVDRLEITPDSTRVIYRGDLNTDNVNELFSAPIDQPGQQTLLSTTPVAGGRVADFQVAPDSSRVVYSGNLNSDDVDELFSRRIDQSGQQTLLSTTPVTGGDLLVFAIAPDGSRVVYSGDMRINDVYEIFSAPTDRAGHETVINTAPVTGGDSDANFRVSPDSSFVVFTGDLTTNDLPEVYASGVGQQPTGAVTDLAATSVTTDTATIAWTPPAFGSRVESYTVTTDPARRRVTTTIDGGATTATVTGLTPDTAYTVSVVATNDGGDSPTTTTTFTTAPSPPPAGVVRLSGADRYATAAAVALDRFDPTEVTIVYLATGRNFPDALAGGPLAAHVGAPILLVEPDSLPDITASTLATLNPSMVIALGGTVAVSNDVLVVAATAAGDAAISRLPGPDRYATAATIADALLDAGGDPTRAFLAIGTNFPDAVAAGPATDGAPILLTAGTTLPDATTTWLRGSTPGRVTAVGGDGVLTGDVLGAAAASAEATIGRLSGPSRYATATAIADASFTNPDTVYLAVGTNFPDALTGGPAAAAEGAPVVLAAGGATELPPDTLAYLDSLPGLRRVVVLGGNTAIPDTIIAQLATLLD